MDQPQTFCILVAEDDAILRMALCLTLSQRGYTVLEAPDGREALRLAGEYDGLIHALVTNIQMPGLDGHGLIRHLKPQRPNLRVLILSAGQERDFPPDAQYDVYLSKYTNPQQVIRTIEQLLRNQREPGRSAEAHPVASPPWGADSILGSKSPGHRE